MKKVVLAFDGTHFSDGAFEFARRLNEKQPLTVAGLFLPQVDYANLWSLASSSGGSVFIPLVEDETADIVKENIRRFENLCQENSIQYTVHKDFFDLALPELKKETRFADLLIMGSESFYSTMGTGQPNDYLKEALHSTECPVLVVPENFIFPESNIIAFDGGASSVYAIKQFAYIFPELCGARTLLVYARDNEEPFPEEKSIRELVARHFPRLETLTLNINPKKYFVTWLSEHKSAILVSGAFGRSALSQMFRKSFVSDVIRDHKLPVFIAHK